jgi:hypothetical protein
MNQTKSLTTQNSHVSKTIRSKASPWVSGQRGLQATPSGGAKRRHNSCAYSAGAKDERLFSTRWIRHLDVFEPQSEGNLGLEESLTRPITARDHAALSLAKGPASMGPTKTADCHSGHSSVAVPGNMSVAAAGVAGNPKIQWDVVK